ncbi:MAG TPA: hypothetical protein VFT72_00435 [Opitutaceae bacterium]|nr:hypothetical protein [Opitutaceae bacterium]
MTASSRLIRRSRPAGLCLVSLALATPLLLQAQVAPASTAAAQDSSADSPGTQETVMLNPFVVDASRDRGYQATNTLAGTRIRTDLADVGSAISVLTKELLSDLGATNNETSLSYALNTEVGGPRGNFTGGVRSGTYQEQDLFANPNGNTRVRGLTSADNTRNFFLSDVPWDGYTVSRVDIQRGPNAILFGLGSPAGVVNATTSAAEFRNGGHAELTFDQFGTQRYVLDYNRELIHDQLAFRLAGLRNNQKFRQDPAFSNDDRLYAAMKYKPGFLNRDGNRLEFSGNFENGNINSNRPRVMTPGDHFSGYWDPESEGGLAQKTYNAFTQDLGNVNSPDYTQQLGGAGLGDLNAIINSKGSVTWMKEELDAYRALKPDGTVNLTMDADTIGPYPRRNATGKVGVRSYSEWAGALGLPFANFGAYKNKTISDPTIFDFYNKLIDGDNKREWTDWHVFDVNATQTFFHDSLGYDVSYFQQKLKRGQWSVLGWTNEIYMDVNQANNLGIPNPDIGRAYVQIENRDGGNGNTKSDRDATRLQLFGEYDFATRHHGWWARLLGLQRLTGVISEENQQTDARTMRYGDLDYQSKLIFAPEGRIEGGVDSIGTGFRYYISDDLRGRSTAAGSNLGNLSSQVYAPQGGKISVLAWDNTWIAGPEVDPGAPWANPYRPGDTSFTQSNNPANYRGWVNKDANFVTINSTEKVQGISAKDYLTSTGTLTDFGVKSRVLVWQGYFWDHAIVGTYGYRRDKARSYIYLSADRNGTGRPDTGSADLDPSTYNYTNPDGSVQSITTTTRNWSVATHLNRFLGEHDFLPFNLSLYYNQGENFQPLAGRIDAFAQPLAPPSGSTRDKSLLIATKDNKYSLRVTQFESEVKNGNSTSQIGAMWGLEQTLFEGANRARNFRAGRTSYQSYTDAGGDATKLQNDILPAWFQFEKDLQTQFPNFVKAWINKSGDSPWGTDNNGNVTAGSPAGFAFTEDSHSKGYEFEFTANPTNNWRVAVNASKTTASRENVPGTAFKEVAAFIENAMQKTDVGLTPMWWDQNTGGGRAVGPWTFFRPDYLANNALNGQSAGEVRKWRFNAITNYMFDKGAINGLGVGGGYRYEDRAIIGYAPMLTEDGDNAINLNAPVYAPSNSTVDLWLSYERKIGRHVKWKIQLNVYNVFGKNELVPFAASVDYDKLSTMGPVTTDTVVPMKASAYSIREGRSWQLTNTFEF